MSPSTELRLRADVDPRRGTDSETRIEVHVTAGKWNGDDAASIFLPAEGLEDLDPQTRAMLVLDSIHSAVTAMGKGWSWPSSALAADRAECVSRRLDYQWASPWKWSRDRKSQARCEYRIDDHGSGWSRLAIRSKDADAPERMSESIASPGIASTFEMLSRSIRWRGSDQLTIDTFDQRSRSLTRIIAASFDVHSFAPYADWPPFDPPDLSSPSIPVVVVPYTRHP
jgi:hypothetical protein